MKKLINLFAIAFALVVIAPGCKGKDSVGNDPRGVVMAFFDKLAKKDVDGASKYATKDSKATLDILKKGFAAAESMKDLVKGADGKDPMDDFKNVKLGEPKITGDVAMVPVTSGKDAKTKDIPLKKEDGVWKVDFSMSTLNKMKDEEGNSGLDNGNDPTGSKTDMKDFDKIMNSDTLQEGLKKAKEAIDKIKPEDLEKMKDMLKNLEKLDK